MDKPGKGSVAGFVLGAALGAGGGSQVGPSEEEMATRATSALEACMGDTPASPSQIQRRLQVCLSEARVNARPISPE